MNESEVRKPEIPKQIDQLTTQVSLLIDANIELLKRLSPAMSQQHTNVETKISEREELPELAELIREEAFRVTDVRDQIIDILERLEI